MPWVKYSGFRGIHTIGVHHTVGCVDVQVALVVGSPAARLVDPPGCVAQFVDAIPFNKSIKVDLKL